MHRYCASLLLLALGLVLGAAAPAPAAPAAPAPVALSLRPAQDLSFPFWCDWGYDWDERCYRDDSDRLPLGGDEDKVWRAGLRFSLASIPRGAEIVEASLSVYHDATCLGPRKTERPCTPRSYAFDLHAILSADWLHEREVDSGPALARAGLASAVDPSWLSWDVTDLVAAWVGGEPNYGVLIRLVDAQEDYGVGGPRLPSSTFANPALRPALDVVYLPSV